MSDLIVSYPFKRVLKAFPDFGNSFLPFMSGCTHELGSSSPVRKKCSPSHGGFRIQDLFE
ncbi:MAG: hypothetical protein ACFFAN_11565 [Promethearchaeota archaeon]